MRIPTFVVVLLAFTLLGCPSGARRDEPSPFLDAATPHPLFAANGPGLYWNYVNLEGQKATYIAAFGGLAWGNGANVQLQGSATKTVKITRVRVGPSRATSAGVQLAAVGIYSTAASGGTPVVLPASRQIDLKDSNASAVLTLFTGVATAGSVVINLRQGELASGASPAVGNYLEWNFCNGLPERCPTLRGTSQYLAFTTTAAVSGQACDLDIDWTEE